MEKPDEKKDETAATEGSEKTETTSTETAPKGDDLGEAGKRAIKAEREAAKAAKKEADELRARLKEYEDRDLSEQEKAAKRSEEFQARAEAAERKLAALEAGLPVSMADRLRGSTPEELAADAAELKKALGLDGDAKKDGDGDEGEKDDKKGDGGATPPGSLDGGARTPAAKKSLDEAIAEAQAKGDHKTVHRLNAMKLAQLQVGAR